MQTEQKNAWDAIKGLLYSRLTADAFQNWVARTEMLSTEGSVLRVAVPDEVTKLWLEGEYAPKVSAVIRDLGLQIHAVRYEMAAASGGSAPSVARMMQQAAAVDREPAGELSATPMQLNPRFRFDNFVVGSCNQFAHAAAIAVATTPSRRYNPLFIYGGSGMGKSHLLHAVAHSLIDQYPGIRVRLTTAERFVNDMVLCIRNDRMSAFHEHYRNADALLIDDIHSIAGKERTQEEFFHTFNELYDHGKQIVLTSDQTPKNTPGLVERLRSRFEWGLMVDVQPPDLETKMAILDKKAEAEGLTLPEDVRVFIATKTRNSVRELEGAWTKLLAYSSVTNSPMTLSMAHQVLKSLQPANEKRVTIDAVIRAVAERHSLQPAQLKQKTNAHEISRPRQIAMYIAKELTTASLPEIGRAFGGKHHTTVLHAIRKVDEIRQSEPDTHRMIQSIMDSFS